MLKQCAFCPKQFNTKRNSRKYCSQQCYGDFRKTLVGEKSNQWKGGSNICSFCNQEYRRQPSTLGKYCSKKCEGLARRGSKHTPETIAKMKSHKGSEKWNWKGGRKIDSNGYIWLLQPHHPRATEKGYVKESHLVAEKELGRFLEPQEVIHHINEIKDDNRPENLYLFSASGEHTSFHNDCRFGRVNYSLISNLSFI